MTNNFVTNYLSFCKLVCITLLFVTACQKETQSTSIKQNNDQSISESVTNIEIVSNAENINNVENIDNSENTNNVEIAATVEVDGSVDNLNNVEPVNNILKDGTFEHGLTYWKSYDDVVFTNFNGESYCFIKGSSNQKMVFQFIEVNSNAVYRLSFDLKTNKNSGAYIVFRDDKIKKEEYFYCNEQAGDNHYEWEFSPLSSGAARIVLSTYLKGDYFFSNVSLVPVKVCDSNCNQE